LAQFHYSHRFFHHIIIVSSLLQAPPRDRLRHVSGVAREQKEQLMKRIAKITLFTAGMAVVVSLGFKPLAELRADNDNLVSVDVACDCRTGVNLDGGGRAAPFMIEGKIFPPGTLPSGTATNDPTQPVHGVASIGDWLCRGQTTFPLPPAVAAAYSSVPFAFNTQYFILNKGGAITAEGYDLPTGGLLSITGGIAGFSGASGYIDGTEFGTNVTGCPNFRATFHLRPGSVRGSD
jgi:hypothetical protein